MLQKSGDNRAQAPFSLFRSELMHRGGKGSGIFFSESQVSLWACHGDCCLFTQEKQPIPFRCLAGLTFDGFLGYNLMLNSVQIASQLLIKVKFRLA